MADLASQGLPEQPGHFRRSHEVAGRSELPGTGRVVAQSRCVEDLFHEARKGNPAAGGDDVVDDGLLQALAMGQGIRIGQRQVVHGTSIKRGF